MKFNLDYRNQLEIQLQKNKNEFLEDCLKFIEKTKDTCYRMSLEQVAYSFYPFKFEYSIAETSINNTRLINPNPIIQNRRSSEKNFLSNELKFILHRNEIPEWFSPEQISYTFQRKLLEFKCEEEFWKNINNENLYKTVSEFDCFNDPIFSSEKVNYYKNKLKYLLHKDWGDYYLKLITLHFPDYVYNEKLSNSKTKRFFKPINNEISIGIEFEIEEFKKTIKRNEFAPPDFINIILVNEYFEKRTSYNDYVLKYNENILSLGICGNPLFHEPCMPMLGYQVVSFFELSQNPQLMFPKYKKEILKKEDGMYQLVHPKDFGEKLKRHAFFYFSALRYTSELYLDYIIKSVKEVSC